MAFRLSSEALSAAVNHLSRYGDTDIFPHLPELAFLGDEKEAIVSELSELDLDSYTPVGAIEALAPKSRYGFRIAHQLSMLDTILLLASVIEIGEEIEAKRQDVRLARAYSYRFSVKPDTGQIFRSDRTFKDWLHRQKDILLRNRKIKSVVCSDISDFYLRVNFHRMENLLDEVAPGHGSPRFIKKHIKIIRARQSFGLPVGGSAARLLAELALSDTDQALKDNDLLASRYVDDFRIFLEGSSNPYDALGYLAEHLGINEGLSLNVAKTSVVDRGNYLLYLEELTTDIADEAEGIALDALTAHLYFDDEPDQEDLDKLKAVNLVGFLTNEIQADNWDIGKIRVIFRALKIIKSKEAIPFINENFGDLIVFAKELCLLMEVLENENPGCFDELLDEVIAAILNPPASSVQLVRTWLLEILVRDVIQVPRNEFGKIERLDQIIDRRQILFLLGQCGDKNYFRRQKTAVHRFSTLEHPALIWGACCLPKDEYKNWIQAVKQHFQMPLGQLFLEWAVANRDNLNSRLKSGRLDHPD